MSLDPGARRGLRESYVGITWLTGHAKPEATGVSVRNTLWDYPLLPQEGRNSFENLQRGGMHARARARQHSPTVLLYVVLSNSYDPRIARR